MHARFFFRDACVLIFEHSQTRPSLRPSIPCSQAESCSYPLAPWTSVVCSTRTERAPACGLCCATAEGRRRRRMQRRGGDPSCSRARRLRSCSRTHRQICSGGGASRGAPRQRACCRQAPWCSSRRGAAALLLPWRSGGQWLSCSGIELRRQATLSVPMTGGTRLDRFNSIGSDRLGQR